MLFRSRAPSLQVEKHLAFEKFYNVDSWAQKVAAQETFDYSGIDSLQKFNGTHPAVMQEVITRKNWHFSADISKKQFTLKGWLLYWVEKYTGRRLFEYRNYKVI